MMEKFKNEKEASDITLRLIICFGGDDWQIQVVGSACRFFLSSRYELCRVRRVGRKHFSAEKERIEGVMGRGIHESSGEF